MVRLARIAGRVAIVALAAACGGGGGGGGGGDGDGGGGGNGDPPPPPTCVNGADCTPASPAACALYAKTCAADGTFTCTQAGAAADGTTCGGGQVCSAGSCVTACVPASPCTPAGAPEPCRTYGKACNATRTGFTCVAGNAADGTSCGGASTCAAGLCQAPCPHATVRVPSGGGAPAWSAEFATWLGANGYAHLAANQGWGGGTGCGGGASPHLPVIMIHGNSSSGDPSQGFVNLRSRLTAAGYGACELFAISWIEQSADTSVNHHKASYLKLVRDFIEAVRGYTGKAQVQVVGWSMGVTTSRKAIKGGTAYEDPARTIGCDLGPSLASGVETFLGVAGVNRGLPVCAAPAIAAANVCSENGFAIDSAFLHELNGGADGVYAPAPTATHVYSIYLPDDEYICGDDAHGRGPWPCEVHGTHTSIVPGGEFARSYDLLNEDYGSSFGLDFHCLPDARGLASNCDHILVFSDPFSLQGMVQLLRDHTTTALPAPPFAQADLAGDWEEVELVTMDTPGWRKASVSIDATGTAVFTNVLASDGTTSSSALTLELDDNGIVTLLDPLTLTSLHGKLSQDRNLVIATWGSQAAGSGSGLMVLSRRVPAVTYGAADVASWPFRLARLETGTASRWLFGTGTTDGTGAMTISSIRGPTGGLIPPGPGFDTLQVDAAGRIGFAGDPLLHGLMTPDKGAVFAVQTLNAATGAHALTVLLSTGRTFTQADVAGDYGIHMLASGAAASSSTWGFGRLAATSLGATSVRYWQMPTGPSLPVVGTLTVDPDGSFTSSANPTYRGQLTWDAAWYVRVQTASGQHSLGFGVR